MNLFETIGLFTLGLVSIACAFALRIFAPVDGTYFEVVTNASIGFLIIIATLTWVATIAVIIDAFLHWWCYE